MELAANLYVSEDVVRSTGEFRPGTLRVDDDGIAFDPRGGGPLESLATGQMASVSISTAILGADTVVVARKAGGAWSIRVSGGERVVEALRARGVPVER